MKKFYIYIYTCAIFLTCGDKKFIKVVIYFKII